MSDKNQKSVCSPIEEVIEDIQNGKTIILVDDEDRENEGDLVCAAQFVTPEKINFMAKHGRGLICLAMKDDDLRRLRLPNMVRDNTSPLETAFTVSIEAKTGVTTGISAADRARTIQVAANPESGAEDIVSPGHVFPLRAREGGVLVRAGQTEGSVDLARLAGLREAAVICEVMNDDGSMARLKDLEGFAKEHDLKIASIADLISYRTKTESLVEVVAEAKMPSKFGADFQIKAFKSLVDGSHHIALVKGNLKGSQIPLVRAHSECLTGDVFGSLRCDCGSQLQASLQQIDAYGTGVLLYMRQQEGRGIGLVNKIKAYALQEKGADTVEANLQLGFKADLRDYGIGAQILRRLGVKKMHLLTNNPRKIAGLEGYGLEVMERVAIQCEITEENREYLKTKMKKLGHLLQMD
jgi:3,4-dihydroxy 2-butanone 4-phosphate synthase/GTP cyclohydrolase II